MQPLPKRFARHAAAIAAANPIAFKDAKAAEESMARSYAHMAINAETTGVSTGGYYFHKNEGEIELWVSPDVIWGRRDD